ncbi:MAG: hypothetical protein IKR18_00385 [Bacteroidaceae bacterium]|nr:hypothetical protein [Bacteroidaceae bacterium]
MVFDVVYSESSCIKDENANVLRMREAALKRCGTLTLSCSSVGDKWGIWMKIGDENVLVNPIDLVSSIFEDDTYCMFDSQKKETPGYFMVEVEKKPYCYHWTLSHSKLDFYSENRFAQEEYVSKIFDVVSLLYKAVQSGGQLAYDAFDVDKEGIVSCYKQLQVKCTWPNFIRKMTKDIQMEDFLFDVVSGNNGERFTIGIGNRAYSTWFSDWNGGDFESIRHQLESYTFEQSTQIKIPFDMSETIIKIEDISVIAEINETEKGVGFKHKDYMLVTIIPNGYVKQPVFRGYCNREQVLNALYNGLLLMALDHHVSGNDDVPDRLNAYNMVKSPLIENCIIGRHKSCAIRQTMVKHIITIDPDIAQLFFDEEGVSYDVEKNGTLDFVYDRDGNPIVIKEFVDWQNEINQIVVDSETGCSYSMDWEQYHNRGIELAQELRKVLSPDFDLWYAAPFEDKSGTIKRPFLVLEPQSTERGGR